MGFFNDDEGPTPSPEPHIKVCHICGHTFDADTGKRLNYDRWFCKEHIPKYDESHDIGIDEYGKQLRRYWRNYVECDENGVIKKEAINPK